ncbi:DUF3488 and DUF4129 domain-containing transglutaminase family protein [Natrialbaceae archaeon GCM10025810]|uniref:transglutaminase TgpA family protein n=1 Tax=Halovalidus salilacus TaxID=3075124 RepID=UPI0036088C8A
MSARTDASRIRVDLDRTIGPGTFRALAVCGLLALTASYVSVLRDVTQAVGGTRSLYAIVIGMIVAATILAKLIRPRTASAFALVATAVGFAYYLNAVGIGLDVLASAGSDLLADTAALATGLPLLRMVEAGIWTLGFVPGPVFLSWYLVARRRYAWSVVPGGFALLFLALTGDAGSLPTLLGTLGAIAVVGFGELERRDGSIAQADLLAIVFAVAIALSLSVTVVPGDASAPAFLGEDGEPTTLEGALDSSQGRSAVGGGVDLSPEVRFTVESERPAYWRTGVYDRFTGDEWVRTGGESAYEGSLEPPPGRYDEAEGVVTAESRLGVMPTPAHPVSVEGVGAESATVTSHGGIQPTGPLLEGDSFRFESAVVDARPGELERAGTDYPDEVAERYRQTPEGVSSEFETETAEVTADAGNPYEAAVAIESHLRSSKEYSLDVDRPSGNVAEEFLLEMEEGYCVYFATTMVQMLRAEDVPARYVTGYSTGQQVDDDEYVVRGLDAHAWVEVYFPGHGWVEFDPTPASDREDAHDERLVDARESGEPNVDTDASADVPVDDEDEGPDPNDPDGRDPQTEPEPPGSDDPDDPPDSGNESENASDPNESGEESSDPGPEDPETNGSEGGDADDGDGGYAATLESVDPRDVAVALTLLGGLVASAHRTGATGRLGREARLYWHGRRGDPDRDAERAYHRLETLLSREYRPREPAETSRAYLAALEREGEVDDDLAERLRRVHRTAERAVYGDGVSRAEADDAIAAVDDLARERTPVVGRLWR